MYVFMYIIIFCSKKPTTKLTKQKISIVSYICMFIIDINRMSYLETVYNLSMYIIEVFLTFSPESLGK